MEELRNALRIAAGDLDGDGSDEVVAVDAHVVRVLDREGREQARTEAPGGVQVLSTFDLDGDGRQEIVAGFGRTVERRDGAARVVVHRLVGGRLMAESVLAPSTERPEIVALLPRPDWAERGLVVAYFESKYMVRIDDMRWQDGRWLESPRDRIRMAMSLAWADVDGDKQPELVVGRVYGDEHGADGDAFLLRPDGARVSIPVTGGVRSLAVADLDGDGVAEVLLGDGWNQDYGKRARALLTRATWADAAFRAAPIDNDAEQYTLEQIIAADLDGDGRPEIVTRGNAHVRVLRHSSAGWRGATVARECRDMIALDLDSRPGKEVMALCKDTVQVIPMPGGTP